MSCKEPTTAMIDDLSIESNKTEVILRIKIDQELKCDEHGNCLKKEVRSSMLLLLPVLHLL